MLHGRGHRSVPHTADTILEAWGPDLASCLAEAARALVEEFTEVVDRRAELTDRPFRLSAPDTARLVTALLDEVIFVVDAEGRLPCEVVVDQASSHSCAGTMRTIPLAAASQVGSVPKSVSLSGLRIEQEQGRWFCRVLVDI